MISGPFPSSLPNAAVVTAQACCCVPDQELHDLVHSFWSAEQISSSYQNKLSAEDKSCEVHFRTTNSHKADGRYIVRLPFKSYPIRQAESNSIAQKMLTRMQNRITQNSTFKDLYVDFLKEYSGLGHMRKLNADKVDQAYFVPHHGILRDSISTKLRVVFNASQTLSDGSTLNQLLYAGPKLQGDLTGVLLLWHLYAYVFSSDVEKMYRQREVQSDDQ